jgi:tetrahydromethanopterin S-methyltransferase subunit B
MSHAMNQELVGYTHLPVWNETVDPDFANQRDTMGHDGKKTWTSDLDVSSSTSSIAVAPKRSDSIQTVVKPVKKRIVSLDDFLNNDDSSSSDSSGDDEVESKDVQHANRRDSMGHDEKKTWTSDLEVGNVTVGSSSIVAAPQKSDSIQTDDVVKPVEKRIVSLDDFLNDDDSSGSSGDAEVESKDVQLI